MELADEIGAQDVLQSFHQGSANNRKHNANIIEVISPFSLHKCLNMCLYCSYLTVIAQGKCKLRSLWSLSMYSSFRWCIGFWPSLSTPCKYLHASSQLVCVFIQTDDSYYAREGVFQSSLRMSCKLCGFGTGTVTDAGGTSKRCLSAGGIWKEFCLYYRWGKPFVSNHWVMLSLPPSNSHWMLTGVTELSSSSSLQTPQLFPALL